MKTTAYPAKPRRANPSSPRRPKNSATWTPHLRHTRRVTSKRLGTRKAQPIGYRERLALIHRQEEQQTEPYDENAGQATSESFRPRYGVDNTLRQELCQDTISTTLDNGSCSPWISENLHARYELEPAVQYAGASDGIRDIYSILCCRYHDYHLVARSVVL